ncbi:MAG: hypothetical protein QXG00_04160 [Candidatus Woesearchaeota archaeon]
MENNNNKIYCPKCQKYISNTDIKRGFNHYCPSCNTRCKIIGINNAEDVNKSQMNEFGDYEPETIMSARRQDEDE